MFICQNEGCGRISEPGQPQHKVVTETREKTYIRRFRRYDRTWDQEEVLGSEIVKEIRVCPDCYLDLTGLEPIRLEKIRPEPKKQFHPRQNKQKRSSRKNPEVYYVDREKRNA